MSPCNPCFKWPSPTSEISTQLLRLLITNPQAFFTNESWDRDVVILRVAGVLGSNLPVQLLGFGSNYSRNN